MPSGDPVKRGRHSPPGDGSGFGALVLALLVVGFILVFTYVLVYAR